MRNLKNILVIILCTLPFGVSAKNLGAGIVIGEPTALSAKYWTAEKTAYDAGLSFFSGHYISIFVDHLWHYPGSWNRVNNDFVASLNPYIGFGGVIVVSQSTRATNSQMLGTTSGSVGLGLRVPFGAEWRPYDPPLGVFAEISPGISVIPSTSLMIQIGVGLRYYF